MKCSICGRKLKNPESVSVGCGPICYLKAYGEPLKKRGCYKAASTSNPQEKPMNYNIPGQISIDDYLSHNA